MKQHGFCPVIAVVRHGNSALLCAQNSFKGFISEDAAFLLLGTSVLPCFLPDIFLYKKKGDILKGAEFSDIAGIPGGIRADAVVDMNCPEKKGNSAADF